MASRHLFAGTLRNAIQDHRQNDDLDPAHNTGWKIRLSGTKAAKKATRGKGDTILRAISVLPKIVQSGRLVASMDDARGRVNVKAVHAIGKPPAAAV